MNEDAPQKPSTETAKKNNAFSAEPVTGLQRRGPGWDEGLDAFWYLKDWLDFS